MPTFDPGKAALPTFINMVCTKYVMTLVSRRNNRDTREVSFDTYSYIMYKNLD